MVGVRNLKKNQKKNRLKKGVRYIAQKLKKYYPKRYKNFNEALKKARQIKSELSLRSDDSSKKIILKNIFSIERIPRKPKDELPEIPQKFYDAYDYFSVVDVAFEIQSQLPENVYVKSKISKENLPLLRGLTDNQENFKLETGKELEEEYFSDFIKWGNELQTLSDNKYPLFYTFLPPIREKGKWVMYLVSSDDEGIKCDYGFDPEIENSPTEIYVCPSNYEDMPYNTLRTEVKKRNIKLKNPTKKKLIEALRQTDSDKPSKPSIPASKPQEKSKELLIEKQKTKQKEFDFKILSEENKKRELDIRQQELDMEKIQYGIMTIQEFKKKWGK